ncbi:MAG: hypothetical protein B6I20_07685 [Bacteroidetes bacterium 4572_117]|nr:MAG: hypothetical protein B6I20_07685 [Bacteroidetes bacterium 4572_117]
MVVKKLMFNFRLIAFLVTVFLLNACKEGAYDFNMDNLSTDLEVNPIMAVPLIDASIVLEELIPDDDNLDTYLIIDETTKFMSVAFESELSSYSIDDFMEGEPLSGDDLGEVSFEIDPQVIETGLNELLGEGEIHLADPSIKVYITNFWKIPARFKFADFNYFEEETSDGIPLTGSLLDDWITITEPASIGDSAITEIIIDMNTTDNIDEVLSSMPHHISFGASFETIPGGAYEAPAGSANKISVSIDLPLEFSLTNIELTDTIEFDLGDDLDTTNVKSIIINLGTENGFPLGIDAQIYFVDENYVVLDSLFDQKFVVTPADVGADGKVTDNGHTSNDNTISLNKTKLDNLLKAKHLIPKLLFNTTDSGSGVDVKLYSDYSFGIKMGALVGLHADFSDDGSN